MQGALSVLQHCSHPAPKGQPFDACCTCPSPCLQRGGPPALRRCSARWTSARQRPRWSGGGPRKRRAAWSSRCACLGCNVPWHSSCCLLSRAFASPLVIRLHAYLSIFPLPCQVLELQSRLEAAQHRERAAQAEAERLRWGGHVSAVAHSMAVAQRLRHGADACSITGPMQVDLHLYLQGAQQQACGGGGPAGRRAGAAGGGGGGSAGLAGHRLAPAAGGQGLGQYTLRVGCLPRLLLWQAHVLCLWGGRGGTTSSCFSLLLACSPSLQDCTNLQRENRQLSEQEQTLRAQLQGPWRG